MKYKSIEKYLKKNDTSKNVKSKSKLYLFLIRVFVVIIIILIGLIFVKRNESVKSDIKDFLNDHSIPVAKINSFYKKTL